MSDAAVSLPVPVTDAALRGMADAGTLNADALTRARELAGFAPTAAAWHTFIQRVCLSGGAALLAAAMVCFIAYNWSELGRWFRFALVEGALGLFAIAVALLLARPALFRALALLAFVSLGGLLAYTGQTYQTGADSYQLFVAWAGLALIWVVATQWWGLWLAWLVVAEIALHLWALGDARNSRWLLRYDEPVMLIALVNTLAFALFYAARRWVHLNVPWLWRFAVTIAVGAATASGLLWIFGDATVGGAPAAASGVLLCVLLLGALWVWASRVGSTHFEPWVLYLTGFGAVSIAAVALGRALLHKAHSDVFFLLLLPAAVLLGGLALGTAHITKLTLSHRRACGHVEGGTV